MFIFFKCQGQEIHPESPHSFIEPSHVEPKFPKLNAE